MLNRILVPLDGSELAEAVLPLVEELAEKLSAEVLLLQATTTETQAIRETIPGGGVSDPGLSVEVAAGRAEAEADAAERYLASVKPRLEAKGLQVSTRVIQGAPGWAVMETAKEWEASLIALATHGRSGLARAIMGSVADEVVRSSSTPVLLVRSQT